MFDEDFLRAKARARAHLKVCATLGDRGGHVGRAAEQPLAHEGGEAREGAAGDGRRRGRQLRLARGDSAIVLGKNRLVEILELFRVGQLRQIAEEGKRVKLATRWK